MALKTFVRIAAFLGAVLMFWLVYVLFALQYAYQLPYGVDLMAWLIDPLYGALRLPAIASIFLVSFALVGVVLLDYALTDKLNL